MNVVLKLLLISFLLTQESASALSQNAAVMSGQQHIVANAIQLLWSADDNVRQTAKKEIIRIGPEAVPALLFLLKDIYEDPGKQRLVTSVGSQQPVRPLDIDNPPYGDSLGLEITNRLKLDAMELLGRLRAVEAVPILIKIMQQPSFMVSYNWAVTMDMRALIRIGAPAVPALVDVIENARAGLSSMAFGDELGFTEQDKTSYRLRELARIQNKAIMVLSEIGDERALPVLERLLDPTRERVLLELESDYVNEAIRRIQDNATKRR